jgi:hypothetical protein
MIQPLRNATNELVDAPAEKAVLFKAQFFPDDPKPVAPAQLPDPTPRVPRTWDPVSPEEITLALSTTSNSSAPGMSGIGYKILKWAHNICPDALTLLFNLCLDSSIHPWKHAKVVVINKLDKPNYSLPKAYHPISLLECTGKLLEKVIAKWFNWDIEAHHLIPMTQFRSHPHHNVVDAVATLVHHIQATCATGTVGTLLLFDISGFFNNINPARATHTLHNLGFPPNVCDWTLLIGRKASLNFGSYTPDPFSITNSTPQGSPLSPVLSALYTASLLEVSKSWTFCDLTLYVDDRAIYATSATTSEATKTALRHYAIIHDWLTANSLEADPSKMELMSFMKECSNRNLISGKIEGARYNNPVQGPNHVTMAISLRYLGVYLDHCLRWDQHITIMANHACSTIRGVNLLGNSIRGLDFLNWRKVYNALVIPVLTYGAQVWYTGVGQKGLVQHLQVAQNKGIHKITSTFRTLPVEPLHNMTGIPPSLI